jgi:hypothetical protein
MERDLELAAVTRNTPVTAWKTIVVRGKMIDICVSVLVNGHLRRARTLDKTAAWLRHV